MKNLFSRIGVKIWNSIPDSDRPLKFKNTLQSRLLNILIREDTYVGLRTYTLIDIFSRLLNFQFNFIHILFHLPILKYMYYLSGVSLSIGDRRILRLRRIILRSYEK